ncbi:MAG: BMC domain-containing protein [Clostridia bacterium]|nr:BMC domain-containing protein [Clostridia bacterium]
METGFEKQAIGIFELDSFCACFVAMDAATKAADVKVQGIERNRLKSGACVKLRGSVANVEAAMEAALAAAQPISKIVAHTVIASPAADTETAIQMTINK